MRKLLTILIMLCAVGVGAATRITLTVTVTNVPVTSNTITINGTTRTWTNAHTATTILTNLVSKNASATNLFNNYASFTIGSGITHRMTDTNVVVFTAPISVALSASSAGNWATTVLSTQSGPSTFTALWPMENMVGETNRTNQGSSLIYGLGIYSTNAFPTNATALTNFITKGAVVGPQHITSELRLSGNLNNGTGNLSVSNLVNNGNAIRSFGSGGNSLQLGSNALAVGALSVAIGNSSVASNTTTLAVGTSARATNDYAMAVGNSALAGGTDSFAVGRSATAYGANSMAIGQGAIGEGAGAIGIHGETVGDYSITIGTSAAVSATNSIGIGYSASVTHNNSVAIGKSATTTATNQIRLGTSTETVSIPGMLEVTGTITNATIRGTNTVNAITVHTPTANTGLANGYNSAVAVNATYVRFSGPSAAYTNVGFSAANKMDGKRALCQFDNPGLSFTILHDSGLDSGDTNRIHTGTGALLNSTNNPVFAEIIYDNAVTRWRVISFR